VSRAPTWIPRAAVLAIHGLVVAEHGGPAGIRDEGLLDSALASVQQHHAYGETDLFVLAAALAHAITRNHPFEDGNKRMSLALAAIFLELNGWRLEAPETDAAAMTLALAVREIEQAAYAEWLRESCTPCRP
jgi:death-on-curing protein